MPLKKIELTLNAMNKVSVYGEPPKDDTEFDIITTGDKTYLVYDAYSLQDYLDEYFEDEEDDDYEDEEEKQGEHELAEEKYERSLFQALIPLFDDEEVLEEKFAEATWGGTFSTPGNSKYVIGGKTFYTKVEHITQW